MFIFSNNASSFLFAAIGPSDTELLIAPGDGALFPEPGYLEEFAIVVQHPTTREREIMYVTERLYGDNFTVVRGREGTVAIAFPENSVVAHVLTAGVLESIRG